MAFYWCETNRVIVGLSLALQAVDTTRMTEAASEVTIEMEAP